MLMKVGAASLVATLLPFGQCLAHKINPLEDKYRQRDPLIVDKLSEPVHEEITQLARACQSSSAGQESLPLVCVDRSNPSREPRGNKHDALVRGVWWNDDPNQLLFAQPWTWIAWMNDARRIATNGRNWRGARAAITQEYYLTYRSHYGDLQFLHAMASEDGEPPSDTRDRILSWAEFTYQIATGRVGGETKLGDVEPSSAREFFKTRTGWTVNYLFAPRYRLKEGGYTRRMAAGSLLHLIQDSYSRAHVDRAMEPSTSCPMGRVLEFHSYTHQDGGLHGDEDSRAAWLARDFTPQQDPVNVSATLLAYIDAGEDWSVVKSYLSGTVFCLDTDARASGPGSFVRQERSAR